MKTSAVNLLTFYAVINVIILAVSSEVTKEAAAKKTGVTEWMKRITDLGFDCSEHDKEDWAQSHDLLKVVSCDETEGIYAYNIKVFIRQSCKLPSGVC